MAKYPSELKRRVVGLALGAESEPGGRVGARNDLGGKFAVSTAKVRG